MTRSNPWAVITTSADMGRVAMRRVTSEHVCDLFWAKDAAGRFAFIFIAPAGTPAPDRLPRLRGVTVEWLTDPVQLRLTLDDAREWELFAAVCDDLTSATSNLADSTGAVAIFLGRLQRWQRLMARDQRGVLTEPEIRGLIGELTFLGHELLRRFGDPALLFWNGPAGSPQDFSVGTTQFEVKATSPAEPNEVHISSAEQLWPTNRLFLVVYVVAVVQPGDRGISLAELVHVIRSGLTTEEGRDVFDDRLADAGYIDSPDYRAQQYLVEGPETFAVDVGFPKIVVEAVPDGVTAVRYSIRLDRCRRFRADIPWTELGG